MEGDAGSGSTRPGPRSTRGSHALSVAFNEVCDGKLWFASTKELQLASLEFCIACRNHQTLHLRVDAETPRTLLAAVTAPPPHPKRLCRTRVPRLRARRMTWNMPTATELRMPIFALKDVYCLRFGGAFNGGLEDVVWPRRLKIIVFDDYSSCFDQPIELVQWPASLQELDFGGYFNQPIEDVEFPPSLQRLVFGCLFNQPIADVILPNSLQYFCVGEDFDHPIEDVRWPSSLEQMSFGKYFNQPIEEVVWPSSLIELTFRRRSRFDQPIEGVVWPASLRQLAVGECFDQPIEWCTFPALLEELEFGADFNQPVEDVTWPDSLQKLAFGRQFNQPVGNVRWPASLEEVSFGVDEVCGVNTLMMFSEFNQPIGTSAWPASMRRLTLGHKFRQSLQGLGTWMPNLETFNLLDYGSGIEDSLLHGIEWPKALCELVVFMDSSFDGVVVPSNVEVSRFNNEAAHW